MIKNIVFDMGNVLLRFDPQLFMERLNVAEEDRPLLMREVYHSLEWSRMDRGSLTDEQASEIICSRVPERLHEQVFKLVTFWDRPLIEIEGMHELVRELKALGYGIYLLSNASYRQHEYWPRLSVSSLFDGIMVSADVKLVKPQPEIYLLFCSTFGLKPDECFFIDDSTLNAEGAFFSGMHTAVFHQDAAEIREKLRAAGVPVS